MIINNQFSLDVKPEWKETTVFTYAGPQEDGIRHDIIITVENPSELPDLATLSQVKLRDLETTLQGYTLLKQGNFNLDDGTPAFDVVFKWYPVENRRIYQRMVYVMGHNATYTITTTYSKKTWKMLGGTLDEIIRSFKLQQPVKAVATEADENEIDDKTVLYQPPGAQGFTRKFER